MAIQTIALKSIPGFQEIKLPENMKIDDDKAYIKKIGNAIYIIPFHNPWQSMIESVDKFTVDFMEERGQQINAPQELFD